MYLYPSGDFFYASWTERIERELAELLPHNGTFSREELKKTNAWESAQKLAKDFESTYHVLKQNVDTPQSLELHRFLGGNLIKLANPELHLPITILGVDEDDCDREIRIFSQKDITCRYVDIQPATSIARESEKPYNGPHLLVDVFIDDIEIDDYELPGGLYVAYIPFKKVEISAEHQPSLNN